MTNSHRTAADDALLEFATYVMRIREATQLQQFERDRLHTMNQLHLTQMKAATAGIR